jgi:DNA-binding CsgD family transcriptional regulator
MSAGGEECSLLRGRQAGQRILPVIRLEQRIQGGVFVGDDRWGFEEVFGNDGEEFGRRLAGVRVDDGFLAAVDAGAEIIPGREEDYVPALAVQTREQMVEQLTPQEQRVAAMLDSPRKAGDIADELGLAEATVRSHVKAIYRKLGTTSRIETVDRLRALGIRGRG